MKMNKKWYGIVMLYVLLMTQFILMLVDVIPDWWYHGYWNFVSVEASRSMNLWLTGVCLMSITIACLWYYLLYRRYNDG